MRSPPGPLRTASIPTPLPFATRLKNACRVPLMLPGLEALTARLTRGRPPSSLVARVAPNHYQYRSPAHRRVERKGFAFTLDISDLMDWFIFYGLVDLGQEVFLGALAPHDTVMDVGANNGYLSLRMARRVGPEGRVISVEPHPENAARFRANLGLNRVDNVQLVEMALGDSGQSRVMGTPDPTNTGMRRIAPSGTDPSTGVRVPFTTVDDLCAEWGEPDLDWIKIDVEGYEPRVIRGARRTIERCHPNLYVEVDDGCLRAQGDSPTDLLSLIEELGYRCRDAATGRAVRPHSALDGCHLDVICAHDPGEGADQADR